MEISGSIRREFLDPRQPLLRQVVSWLCGDKAFAGNVRREQGAYSLSHVMVVVPTAESGRNLRLELAKEAARRGWGGILPPKVVLPMQLVKPADENLKPAGATEIAAAFIKFLDERPRRHRESDTVVIDEWDHLFRVETLDNPYSRLALLDQLNDIWRILAGRGLIMEDVLKLGQKVLEADIGDEYLRWKELSELEKAFFGFLEGHLGLKHHAWLVREAKRSPAVVSDEIEKIVLPALSDPVRVLEEVLLRQKAAGKEISVLVHADKLDDSRFDEWGRPITSRWIGANRPVLEKLTNADIVTSPSSASLAERLACDYPSAAGDAALPALGLCDAELFGAVAASFLAAGYVVHNPERHKLISSSLGRMIWNLSAFYGADRLPWKEFIGFFRSDDVLSALGLDDEKRKSVLDGVDAVQNAYIPAEIPGGFEFPRSDSFRKTEQAVVDAFLECACRVEKVFHEAAQAHSLPGFVRGVLKWVFAARRISRGSGEREFKAAADAARAFLNALESESVAALKLNAAEQKALMRRELDAACYSLEPDAVNSIRTEGWLELAWSPAERFALTGLHEGKVPDSVVGHPFLPDALRKELGLVSNDDRLARDTWLISELLSSHESHAVHVYVARTNDVGDICRPSRLLYLCGEERLPDRITHLFGDTPSVKRPLERKIDWNLNLPEVVEMPRHFSPSSIDAYVKCPFTYLLKNVLKMRPYKDKVELGADDFGTLVHEALEMYARIQIDRGDDQLTDEREIAELLQERIIPAIRSRYADAPVNIELQLQSIEGRLRLFAEVQARWAKSGWRIRMAEREIPESLKIPGLNFAIHGYIDRVDENICNGADKPWSIVDYKTWDNKKLTGRVVTSGRQTGKGAEHRDFARLIGYAAVKNAKGEETAQRILSVQLPIYGLCLAAMEPKAPVAAIEYHYLVLGESREETGFQKLKQEIVEAGVQTARTAVENIGKNIFWPPGPGEEWKYDFNGLFVSDPEKDLGDGQWARAHSPKREAGDDRV